MFNKIKHAIKKGKKVFIIVLILWIALSIVFVAPITVSKVEATNQDHFFDLLWDNFSSVKQNMTKVFKVKYFKAYARGELYLTCALIFTAFVGIFKSLPKNEYTDIEHGSSDWATGGEQYKVLSAKKGILLAEKNFLPLDKRGNTNVLVVGRFWFW